MTSPIRISYSDEDKINEQGKRFDLPFKPDYSPNLLLGHNYITHFVVVSRALLDKVGALRSEYDGSQIMTSCCVPPSRHITFIIFQMLYHWRTCTVAGDPEARCMPMRLVAGDRSGP